MDILLPSQKYSFKALKLKLHPYITVIQGGRMFEHGFHDCSFPLAIEL